MWERLSSSENSLERNVILLSQGFHSLSLLPLRRFFFYLFVCLGFYPRSLHMLNTRSCPEPTLALTVALSLLQREAEKEADMRTEADSSP
jgi:hypothetical protein